MRVGNLRQIMLGLNGSPTYLGTIDASSTGKSQATATSSFTIPPGAILLLQTDASVFVVPTLTSDGKLTVAGSAQATSAMVQIDVSPVGFYLVMTQDKPYLWCRNTTGTSNVKVFQVQ